MFIIEGAGVFAEAAGLLAMLSAVFAVVSLGGLAIAQSETGSRAPRGWVRLAVGSWSVFAFSMSAVVAFVLFAH